MHLLTFFSIEITFKERTFSKDNITDTVALRYKTHTLNR